LRSVWLALCCVAPCLGSALPSQETSARTQAVAILRDSRRKDAPSEDVVVERLARCGLAIVDPLLDPLRERKLPPLAESDRAQTLSVPQRELILGALGRWSPRAILPNVEARVAADPSEASRVAALYVYSSHGSGRHLSHLFELAAEPVAPSPQESDLSADEADALRFAVARILERDTAGFRELSGIVQRARAEDLRPLLFALGDTGDACAIPALTLALRQHPQLASLAISQARRVGTSFDAAANRALADAVRPYLAAERAEDASAAARELGELGDPEAAKALLTMLGSSEPQLQESAHWALRRMSRLDFGARKEPWSAWLASEREWWDVEAPARIEELVRGSRATRLAAVASVGARTWRRHEAAEALLAALWDNDPLLREAACHALGQLSSPLALPRLVELLADSDPRVVSAARAALLAIVGTRLPDSPEECRKVLHIEP